MTSLKPWKTLESTTVFAIPGRVEVSLERVELPDGRQVEDYCRVRLGDFAILFVEMQDGRILCFRQYRHGPKSVSLCLPGGHIEADETPEMAARRELIEETGHEAASIVPLGRFVTAGNQRGNIGHAFHVVAGRKVRDPDSGDLEETETVLLDRAGLIAALKAGEFTIASDLSVLALALLTS